MTFLEGCFVGALVVWLLMLAMAPQPIHLTAALPISQGSTGVAGFAPVSTAGSTEKCVEHKADSSAAHYYLCGGDPVEFEYCGISNEGGMIHGCYKQGYDK